MLAMGSEPSPRTFRKDMVKSRAPAIRQRGQMRDAGSFVRLASRLRASPPRRRSDDEYAIELNPTSRIYPAGPPAPSVNKVFATGCGRGRGQVEYVLMRPGTGSKRSGDVAIKAPKAVLHAAGVPRQGSGMS